MIKGEVTKHKLSKIERRLWSDFMTPEYIFTENGKEYYYTKFIGYDHMETEHTLITINEALKLKEK